MIQFKPKEYKTYKKGERITSLDELAKSEFAFFGETLYHNGWFMSFQLRHVTQYVKNGYVRKAVKIKNEEICS